MPFGLTSAPSRFQELMDKVLQGVKNQYAIAYLDDVIVYTKTFDEHLQHLEDIFTRLKAAGLKLKESKCEFLKPRLQYLGHIISTQGIEPDPLKVRVISELKPPRCVRDIRAFNGMVGFYRKFIPNFAEVAQPLTALTRKNARFQWGPEAQGAFETLKERLCQTPILGFVDVKRPGRRNSLS